MTFQHLVDLGFSVSSSGDDVELVADLLAPIANPLSRRFIGRATFRLREGRLVALEPAELAGLPPIVVADITRISDFEARLQAAFDDAVLRLQRRGAELQALGLQPRVDPQSLHLSADVAAHGLELRIAADRQGNFHVVRARRRSTELPIPAKSDFELSEFRDLHALATFLEALVTEEEPGRVESGSAAVASRAGAAQPAPMGALALEDLASRFGARAVVPIRTPVEIVVDLAVGNEVYRFAASRVVGRTFRGLLAGPRGKVWADRFELDAFPGVVALAAEELEVSESEVEVLGLATPRVRAR
jgi:hypothetical protein